MISLYSSDRLSSLFRTAALGKFQQQSLANIFLIIIESQAF